MKKVWITGANGHLGAALSRLLDPQKYTLLLTDRDTVDITRPAETRAYTKKQRPEVILNTTGFNHEDGCETDRDRAYLVNALGARNLAVAARESGAKLVQISTDDVFSHKTDRPYNEFDTASPASTYGCSKLAGEQFIRALCPNYVIVRSSWVYGIGADFAATVLSAAKDPDCPWLGVPTDRFASPTSAAELAAVISNLIDGDCLGVYHAVCPGTCSRYDFARELLQLAGLTDSLQLKPLHGGYSVAGLYTVLDNMMLRLEGLPQPKAWRDALKDYVASL